jgi:threonine dehydrogenase-like Zn-dependent dehydrogenase
MKAVAAFFSERRVGLVDHPEPEITGPRQVKLRMLMAGICGTDREIASFAYGAPPPGCKYLILGHEGVGEVVEVGEGVKEFNVGDLAVPTVRRPCPHGHCGPCQAGRQDFCVTGRFTERGIMGEHGIMAEYAVDHERHMVKVLPAIRDVAVLTEPLTVAEKAMEQAHAMLGRMPGGRKAARGKAAVVIGAGPVGLLGAMKLVDSGYRTLVYSKTFEGSPAKAIAAAMGADFVDASEHAPAALGEMAGEIGLIYEAAGAAKATFEVLAELGVNGVCVLTGIPAPGAPVEVDAVRIMRNMVLKNQALAGTVNAGHAAYAEAARDLESFLRRFPEAVKALMTARVRLEDVPEALAARGGVKTVIEIA